MVGIGEFAIPPWGIVRIQVRRGASETSPSQRDMARRALMAIRFGVERQEPSMLALFESLVAALEGAPIRERTQTTGSSGLFGPARLGAGERRTREGRQRTSFSLLEEATDSGRLVIEEIEREALVESFHIPTEPPPPRKRERESSETFFEVRFVDETGQAINGVTVEIVTSEPNEVTTNAGGVALLNHVTASTASVQVKEPSELERMLDARWVKPRLVSVPRVGNLTELLFRGGPVGPLPIKAAVPNTIVLKPPRGCLFVELWDKSGRVLHRECKYRIQGPSSFSGTTDEQGRLRHDEVFPGNYELELEVEFFDGKELQTDKYKSPLVVLEPATSTPQVRMLGAVPHSVLVRLHMAFNSNKAFLLPTALSSLRALRKLYIENSPSKLLVVGHADTKGGAAFNDKLSLERAKATIAYLRDDVDAWLAFYDDPEPKKRWGKVENHLMLMALPGYRSRPPGEGEVEFFQRTRGLQVDGNAGPATRRALVAEYMALDGASLDEFAAEIETTAHGCGENFPLDQRGEELDTAPQAEHRDPLDRRIELFFFDEEFGILPKPAGNNSKAGGIEYPAWRKSASQIHDLTPGELDGPKVTFVEMADAHFRTNSAVVLPEGEDPNARGEHQALSSAASVIGTALRLNEEHRNRSLLVAGHTDTTADTSFNQELSEERAACTLALLVGDRASFQALCHARHKVADVKQILSWAARAFAIDCDPGVIDENGSTLAKPISRFQAAYNERRAELAPLSPALDVNGRVLPPLWGAFFDCYEMALQQELGEDANTLAALREKLAFCDPQRRSLGFSEFFPMEELGVDHFRSQLNRRTEILFFEPGEEPDLEHAQLDPETSEIYLPGHYLRKALPPRKTTRVISISIVVASLQSFRIAHAPFTIRTDTGATIAGQTDDSGRVSAKLPADTREFDLSVQDPEPLPEFQTVFEQRYQVGKLAPPTTARGAIQRLRMLGLWTGPELVIFTEGTVDALRHFQILTDLTPTGQLDGVTAATLDQVVFESPGAPL